MAVGSTTAATERDLLLHGNGNRREDGLQTFLRPWGVTRRADAPIGRHDP